MSKNTILIYTDGSCLGNPGPGGWGVVIVYDTFRVERSGFKIHTTNNEMELLAVIKSLEVAPKGNVPIEIFTDSQYVRNALTEGWLQKWLSNNWKTSQNRPVKNRPLWEELHRFLRNREVKFNWLPGHAGIPDNERADDLAKTAARWAKEKGGEEHKQSAGKF